jgi:hypothetical protein
LVSIKGDPLNDLFRQVASAYPGTARSVAEDSWFVPAGRPLVTVQAFPRLDFLEQFRQVAAMRPAEVELDVIARALEACRDLPVDTRIPGFRYTIA